MQNERLKFYWLFYALFFVTLMNHGAWVWLFSSFALTAFVIYFSNNKIPSLLFKYLISGFLIICLYSIKFWIFDSNEVPDFYKDAFINNFVTFTSFILIFASLSSLISSSNFNLIRMCLKPLLMVHMLFFIVQIVTFYGLGVSLDFVFPFTGEESRFYVHDYGGLNRGIFRGTGLFSEPSFYASVTTILVTLCLLNDKFKISIIVATGIFFIFLSGSTAGAIMGSLLVAIILVKNINNYKILFPILGLIPVILILFFDLIYDYSNFQIEKYEASKDIRLSLVFFDSERSVKSELFGYGPFGMNNELYYYTIRQETGRKAAALNDSGLLIYLMLNFGLSGIAIYLFIAYKQAVTRVHLALFLIVSLSKVGILHPVFLLYLALAPHLSNVNKNIYLRTTSHIG